MPLNSIERTANGYRAGKFHFTVDGNVVIVTKDTKDGIITIRANSYDCEDTAWNKAYNSAKLNR